MKIHGVLQRAAQRGAQLDFSFGVLQSLLSCSKMSLHHLKLAPPCREPPEALLEKCSRTKLLWIQIQIQIGSSF